MENDIQEILFERRNLSGVQDLGRRISQDIIKTMR